MGMFDYLICEAPLPDGWKPDLMQTKDFDCQMVTHTITEDGRFFMERITHSEIVPKEERPYPDAPENSLMALCGSVRTHTTNEVVNINGWVNFYGSEGAQGPDYKWHEYWAKFADGKLVEIVMEDPRGYPTWESTP